MQLDPLHESSPHYGLDLWGVGGNEDKLNNNDNRSKRFPRTKEISYEQHAVKNTRELIALGRATAKHCSRKLYTHNL